MRQSGSSQIWHSRPSFEDITEIFIKGTNELEVGELLHTNNFSLIDAMSVIEIMDPKMDTGMQLRNSKGELIKLENINYDVTRPISLNQLVGVMDQLFCSELTWYSGYSLSQTLYTCHYIYNISQVPGELAIENLLRFRLDGVSLPIQPLYILKSYVVAVIKCSQLVWQELRRGQVYEEEDFSTNFKGLSFYVEQTVIDSLNMLSQSIEQVDKELDRIDVEENVDTKGKLAVLWKGALHRLLARKSYLEALNALSEPQCLGYDKAKFSLEKTLHYFKGSYQSSIPSIKPIDVAVAIEEAFDPRILRTLHTSAPPRPVQMIQFETASEEFCKLIEQLLLVCCSPEYPSIYDLMQYFTYFSVKFPEASPISRSWLQSSLTKDKMLFGKFDSTKLGRQVITWFLPEMSYFLNHGDSYLKVRFFNAFNKFDNLVHMLSQLYLQIFHLASMNQSRRRRCRAKLFPAISIMLNQLESPMVQLKPYIDFAAGITGSQTRFGPDLTKTSQTDPKGRVNNTSNNTIHSFSNSIITNQNEYTNGSNASLQDNLSHNRSFNNLVMREQLHIMTLFLTEGFHLNLYSDHERPSVYLYISYLHRHQTQFYIQLLGVPDDSEGHQLHARLKDLHFENKGHYSASEPTVEQILTVEAVVAFTNYHIAQASYSLIMLLIANKLHPPLTSMGHLGVSRNQIDSRQLDMAYITHIDPEKQYNSRFKPFQEVQDPAYLEYSMVSDLHTSSLAHDQVSSTLVNKARQDLLSAFAFVGTLTGLAHSQPSLFGSRMVSDTCQFQLELMTQAVCNNLAFLNQWSCLPITEEDGQNILVNADQATVNVQLRKCELKNLQWILQPSLV